jgi:hypothetical protein
MVWRGASLYQHDSDFIFPSDRLTGEKPASPNTILKKIIRPALKEAQVTGKVIGWHSFRHSLAQTCEGSVWMWRSRRNCLGTQIAGQRWTSIIHGVSAQKHEATGKIVDLLLPQPTKGAKAQHPSAPLESQLAIA